MSMFGSLTAELIVKAIENQIENSKTELMLYENIDELKYNKQFGIIKGLQMAKEIAESYIE